MLESDEIEYKKLTDFGANFIDPFMAFPAAKLATFGAKTTLKGVQKGINSRSYIIAITRDGECC